MHVGGRVAPPREFAPRWWIHAALLAGAIATVWFHIRVVPISTEHWGLFRNMLDVHVYAGGGLAVLEDRAVYEGPVYWRMAFTYPPFAAILFTAIAGLGDTALEVTWTVLSALALYATIVLSWKALGYRVGAALLASAVPMMVIATLLEPVRTTIWYGQINLILLLLVVWDLSRARGSKLRGIGMGLAAGIKLTPGFFLVYLAITRQWRALVTAASTIAATILIAGLVIPRDSLRFWRGTLFESERIGAVNAPSNQSITGALTHLMHTAEPPLWAVGSLSLLALALGLAAMWLAYRAGQELLAGTIAGLTAATISPFSWGHHWVWFVPLIIALSHYAAISRHRLIAWLLPVAAAIPAISWVQTFIDPLQPGGVFYAIGTFMLLPPDPALVILLRAVFPLVFVVVTVVTILVLAPRRGPATTPPDRAQASRDKVDA
ncbi:glycosyltransferase 87 family protein [Lolliginicoccus suaedae]|uniref:glycosyltransferase 87 family protein n=1 Tax=Lolliginicoccus suaedae TaxID=2605429 RepID=UPI001659C460|nr:glycosyltransferase 87 family protein [Lolliginicoccus suaedae]